jgi:hypothetical protein
MENPYGIMHSGKYNYFSHLRLCLFGQDSQISASKRITKLQYEHTYEKMKNNVEDLEIRLHYAMSVYFPGTGFDSILEKIAIDNMNIELRLYGQNKYIDEVIKYIFGSMLQHNLKDSISFSKLIETTAYHLYNGVRTTECKSQVTYWKSTLNDPPVVLSN